MSTNFCFTEFSGGPETSEQGRVLSSLTTQMVTCSFVSTPIIFLRFPFLVLTLYYSIDLSASSMLIMATAGLLDLPSDVLLYLLNTIVAGQHCDKHKHTNLNVAAVLRLCGVSKRLLDYFKQRLKLEADRHLQIWSELALDKKGQQECLCFHIEDDRRLHRPMTDIYELRGERFAKVPKRSPPELDQVMRYSIGKTVEMLDHYSVRQCWPLAGAS